MDLLEAPGHQWPVVEIAVERLAVLGDQDPSVLRSSGIVGETWAARKLKRVRQRRGIRIAFQNCNDYWKK